VKRFLLLLALVAGGLAAASLSVPSNAAVVNGQAISQGQLNSDVSAIVNSPAYRCYLNAQVAAQSQAQATPPIAFDGAGYQVGDTTHSTAAATFVTGQLDSEIEAQIVSQIADQHHVRPTAADLRTTQNQFDQAFNTTVSQSTGSCGTSPNPVSTVANELIQENVRLYATVAALERKLSGIGSSNADLTKFFQQNRSIFDQVCYSVATFSSVQDAQAARAAIYEGATFQSIAAQTSAKGPQGCEILYNVVTLLPGTANVQGLALNTPSNPIAVGPNEVVLLEITARSPNHFSTVKSTVQKAVGTVQSNQVGSVINAALQQAHILVNPRYGTWKPTQARVVAPLSPGATSVLNAGANAPGSTAASSSLSSGRFG
jgi:hypothetical protein